MSAAFRRIVHFLLITLVINGGGWTFNREAVADSFYMEASQTALADDELSAEQSGDGKTSLNGAVCNHWCHAVDHFVGIFPLHPILQAATPDDYFVFLRTIVLPSLPEGRYRPPRLFS